MKLNFWAGCLLLLASFSASAEGFDPAKFERWVEMRVGTGEPVYWYSIGTIRSYPGGELIALMEGYDTARLDLDNSHETKAVQLSRKTYIYKDPNTGEIFKDEAGKPIAPISYPYQLISYELKGNTMETWVEQGAGARKQRIGPGTDIRAVQMNGGVLYNAPLFLDMELPGNRRYQTFENYDFFSPDSDDMADSYITFVRYGDAPRWSAGGKAIMHMTTQRFDKFEQIPESFRQWVRNEAELWVEPPKTLAEIRQLQE